MHLPPFVPLVLGLLGGLWLAGPAAAGPDELEQQYAAIFQEPEPQVRPSPRETRRLELAPGEKVIDFDLSPEGPEAHLLVQGVGDEARLRVWSIDGGVVAADWPLPAGFTARAITSHPRGRVLFVSGSEGAESQILRLEPLPGGWDVTPIYRTPQRLRRLLVGPRPFYLYTDDYERGPQYRLFFGRLNPDGSYGIRSIGEHGGAEYQLLGPQGDRVGLGDQVDVDPQFEAPYALPMAFHPAGDSLLWQDRQGCFLIANYQGREWGLRWPEWLPQGAGLSGAHTGLGWDGTTAPLWGGERCGGSITATPNGLGLIHWQPGQDGVTVYLDRGRTALPQAAGLRFLATPSSVPDGRGLVGLIDTGGGQALVYQPIEVPLADVVDAWMFADAPEVRGPLMEAGGLWRATGYEQMYQLYESELYAGDGDGYDSKAPSRPYLVTSDLFWEIFAAAYEGLFVLQEKERAIPAFWGFVGSAAAAYRDAPELPGAESWGPVFATLQRLHDEPGSTDPEIVNIRTAGVAYSALFDREVDYRDLKPRSHYTLSPGLADYFRGFKYLTQVAVAAGATTPGEGAEWTPCPATPQPQVDNGLLRALTALPEGVKDEGRRWIDGYRPFIAPSRRPQVWEDASAFIPPPYLRPHPLAQEIQLFPLSWGFDNEVLNSTVCHSDWPPEEQIVDRLGEPRLLPSGLDLAAALGSPVAGTLLQGEIDRYPNLGPVMEGLRRRAGAARSGDGDLYQRWLAALAVQWADGVAAEGFDPDLWHTKRLQTGLASWATLRHATLLVNERAAAEAGEGGFEEIVMRPPRGYVEPDPATFEAIAGLFDAAVGRLPELLADARLVEGVRRRLQDSAAKARLFAGIAAKELRGEPITPAEYGHILYIARVAEHHFLLYKALANPVAEYAISEPEPIPKVADVAGGPAAGGVLLSGVGRPLEWVQVVPHFGRRQLVKGAIYSYYELASGVLLDDTQWREMLPQAEPPPWVEPWLLDPRGSVPAAL